MYVNGDINMFWSINANTKQFDIKLFFIVMLRITKVIASIVEISLYVNLRLGLIIGLFFVSAGLFLNISKQPVEPIIIFIVVLK